MDQRTAPNFALPDRDGNIHQLADLNSRFVIVFFYPKDNTPGCTIEAQGFQEQLNAFIARDATIVGISGGTNESKATFCDSYRLTFLLLTDADFAVAQSYGAYGTKLFFGKSRKKVLRKTFVLDEQRKIIRTYEDVTPLGHAEEVLSFLDSLTPAAAGAM